MGSKVLPVVYICENNLYATATKVKEATLTKDFAERAAGYGIPGFVVDGNRGCVHIHSEYIIGHLDFKYKGLIHYHSGYIKKGKKDCVVFYILGAKDSGT